MIKLFTTKIQTPIGSMLAIANENSLLLLQFIDSKYFDHHLNKLVLNANIIETENHILINLKKQLNDYFLRLNFAFEIPISFQGTKLQCAVWNYLCTIKLAATISYKELAIAMGNYNLVRAVANCNAANKFAIIVPCHRVIANDGSLSGYAAGVDKKLWLLEHETKFSSNSRWLHSC